MKLSGDRAWHRVLFHLSCILNHIKGIAREIPYQTMNTLLATIRTNAKDIATILGAMFLLTIGLFIGATYFPPLAYFLNFFWFLVIASLVFMGPWFFLTLTAKDTFGNFINHHFVAGWHCLGKPSSFRVKQDGSNWQEGDAEPYRFAGQLAACFKVTIAVWCVMMLAGAIVAWAAFQNGISITTFGG